MLPWFITSSFRKLVKYSNKVWHSAGKLDLILPITIALSALLIHSSYKLNFKLFKSSSGKFCYLYGTIGSGIEFKNRSKTSATVTGSPGNSASWRFSPTPPSSALIIAARSASEPKFIKLFQTFLQVFSTFFLFRSFSKFFWKFYNEVFFEVFFQNLFRTFFFQTFRSFITKLFSNFFFSKFFQNFN